MMRTSLFTLLVVGLLAANVDGWGFRLRRFTERVATAYATKVVVSALPALGKRGAPPCLEATADQLDQLAADMSVACTGLVKDFAATGVSAQDVEETFLSSDDNGDGLLFGSELDNFASAIELIDACASVEGAAEVASA